MHALTASAPSISGFRDVTTRVAHRRSRIAVIAAVSLLYAAALVLNATALLQPPQLSLRLSNSSADQVRVAWILPGGYLWNQGVRPGQQILRLNGVPVHGQKGAWQGTSLAVRIGTGVIRITSAPLRRGRTTWPLAALSPWFLLLGTLVLLRATPRSAGKGAYALFASAAFALALAGASDGENLLGTAAESVVIPLFAFAFARFFLLFPVPRRPGRWMCLLVLPALATAALGLAELIWPSLYAPVSLLQLGVLLAYLLAGIALLVRGFLDTRDPDLRHGMAVLGGATVISILPFCTLSLAPQLLGHQSILPPEEAIVALAVLPAGFSYAVLRHNILRAPLIQRWLVQAVLWGVLGGTFGAALYALYSLAGSRFLPVGPGLLLASILVVIAGLSLRWLHDRLVLILDRAFFKDAYDYRGSLHQLSQELSLASDLDAVCASLLDRLRRLMNLDFAVLLIQDESGVRLRGASGRLPLSPPAAFVTASDANDKPRLVSLTDNEPPSLLVPLRVQDTLVGHLCLGAKASGEPFRPADRDLLDTLGGHVATLVRNAQLMDDLRQHVQTLDVLNDRLESAQEAERARLAAELHDEPLQTALQLRRLCVPADAPDDPAGAGSAANLSRAIVDQLRAVCSAMRPPVLDDLGLVAALEALASHDSASDNVSITLDADGELRPTNLTPELELTLYRAAQEALNNCRRHAAATDIRVSLERLGDTVHLCVADNGSGFAVPARLDSLAAEGHLGLAGLERRVARAGGRLIVTSREGEGATVQVSVPAVGGDT